MRLRKSPVQRPSPVTHQIPGSAKAFHAFHGAFHGVISWLNHLQNADILSPRMPSGCPECRALADSCVLICRELEWLISRQKLELIQHNFQILNSFEPDIDRLNRKRQEAMLQIARHLECHSSHGLDDAAGRPDSSHSHNQTRMG